MPPGHPERAERLRAIEAALAAEPSHPVAEPREADPAELARVHDAGYLQRLLALRGRSEELDPDTYVSAGSVEAALLAAGASVDAARRVLGGEVPSAVAFLRPPGHHAERDGAMGFCLLNNVAVAAAAARAAGAARVAIVDYDVHHGNGTQHIFYDDPAVLYVSTHQYPYYPGTGAAGEIGRGAGEGTTVNLPLPAGMGDAEYLHVFHRVVLPALEAFRPDLLLLSAGFDAHRRDPLGQMNLTTAGYAGLTRLLVAASRRLCGGRMVALLEGGYDLVALGECGRELVRALADPDPSPPPAPNEGGVNPAALASAQHTLAALAGRGPLGLAPPRLPA